MQSAMTPYQEFRAILAEQPQITVKLTDDEGVPGVLLAYDFDDDRMRGPVSRLQHLLARCAGDVIEAELTGVEPGEQVETLSSLLHKKPAEQPVPPRRRKHTKQTVKQGGLAL